MAEKTITITLAVEDLKSSLKPVLEDVILEPYCFVEGGVKLIKSTPDHITLQVKVEHIQDVLKREGLA